MDYRKQNLVTFYKKGGEILAYWPFVDVVTARATYKQGYAHTGQHCEINPEYIRGARLATLPEYMPLLLELISIGYNDLQICNISRKLPSEFTEMDIIRRAYIECLIWVNEEQLKINSDVMESAQINYLSRALVILFNSKFGTRLEHILKSDQIGHAMYLTQHHHGAGFMDHNEIPDDMQTEINNFLYSFGELYPYVKNKKLYAD
jgi:hypothetical protein